MQNKERVILISKSNSIANLNHFDVNEPTITYVDHSKSNNTLSTA